MRFIKTILLSLVMLCIGCVLGVLYVWKELTLQGAVVAIPEHTGTSTPVVVPIATTTSAALFTKPVTISTDSLPPAQKKVLDTLGVGSKQITITPGMVSCAVDALGSSRAVELKNGAAPSLAEGLTLLTCLKK